MASRILSKRDLEFCLYEWLDVELLTKRERFAEHSREVFDDVLALAERVATERFAPLNRLGDTQEPRLGADGRVVLPQGFADALCVFGETGLLAAAMDAEVGGMQLPRVVAHAATAWLQAAAIGLSSYPFLTLGAAELLAEHGTPEQVRRWVLPMAEGRFTGTMCLSEPQAGSSLADITTLAEPQDDGSWRVTGTKTWISAGDHELSEDIVHLVLARTPGAPAGVRGISLFVVPKVLLEADGSLGERNDITTVGLNHKMGYRATTNCVLAFGDGGRTPGGRAGAVGELVGELHQGLAAMFLMMNGARVGVGAGAAALGCTAYLHALDYAKGRPQGRRAGKKEPSSAQVPIVEHADVRRMLLAAKCYAEGGMGLVLYTARLLDDERTAETAEERAQAHLLLDVLTPITKSWPSQWSQEAASLAIQVLGGAGYTRDFPVEQIYRDNRLNPIHEGTHGIQGMDLLGRKVTMQGGAGLALLLSTLGATAERARQAGGELEAYGDALTAACARIAATTVRLWSTGDAEEALAGASVYLEAVGHVVVAWVWLEQLLAAEGRVGDFYEGKRAAGRFFFRWELPRTGPQLDLLDSLDTTPLDTEVAWL